MVYALGGVGYFMLIFQELISAYTRCVTCLSIMIRQISVCLEVDVSRSLRDVLDPVESPRQPVAQQQQHSPHAAGSGG